MNIEKIPSVEVSQSFQLIPAIDLLDAKLVRLYQGNYHRVSHYNADPVQQALEFAGAGASLIHIVDLDAARSGQSSVKNHDIIQRICKALQTDASTATTRVQLGGGIRNAKSLRQCLELGVDRCVIGTAAIKNPAFLRQALEEHGADKIIVGVDVQAGQVRISGWEEKTSLSAKPFLLDLETWGVKKIIFTDITRDGTLKGPADITAYMECCQLNFIASGGLSSIADLETLLANRHPRLTGVISGRAIYEKKLDLKQALELCIKNGSP